MVILAIDSGLERTGWAVFEKTVNGEASINYLTSGLIKTLATESIEQRLQQIHKQLSLLVKAHRPETIVVEQLFFFKNQKTAIKVAQAQGVAMLVAAENKLSCEFLTPLQIKSIVTGYGRSDKKAVQKMLKLTLNLDKELKQDDQADAIACGLAYCYLNKSLVK